MVHKEDLFRHFRSDERPFAERVLDWMDQVERRSRPVLTPFLNPREQTITDTLVKRAPELGVAFDGGFFDAERKRARIFPPWQEDGDNGLAFLELKSVDRSSPLKHPDVLGSLLGLGVKREVLGDLLPRKSHCQVIIAGEISDFIRMQLNRVGRIPVRLMEIKREEIRPPRQETEMVTVSVASLRVDALAAEAFRLSRSKTNLLIKNGRCHINWKSAENPAETVCEGDVISLRGQGRVRVGEILGETRKGRRRIQLIRFL
ncbi:RNA-binding protein [Kroppenstedtia guangzhouensis]|uniref:RNA-binding protein n=1 Tax=Kroppenstedtia guangzhouensis TaxID=1274356 RepID=A0ABQ1FY04_9BACL|nr:YlmH/Sll1252 family protein [Kroppenstedtia guangzhouensis]GGA32728.1 RNA-binding protein [Kroppenstedtia guangzhouensis]